MAVKTILVESDQTKIQEWKDCIREYDRETSKTAALDLSGLGTPSVAAGETLEEVLDLLGQSKGGIGLIFAHANAHGFIMRICANANSAQVVKLGGISRAWKAIDEIIKLRSAKWPASGKPEFLIDVPAAVKLFENLLVELNKLDPKQSGGLAKPSTVTNREQADAWFDQWMEQMAKACLGGSNGESDLRRVMRAMQKVRDCKLERIEIRACNIGKDKATLDALKEFFGAGMVVAPKVTMFFGRPAVVLNSGGSIDQFAKQLGGFRGHQFTSPGVPGHPRNNIPGGEPAVATGRRNRILSSQGHVDVIMQLTEDGPTHFKFKGRVFATTSAAVSKFLQANYKSASTFAGAPTIPAYGMWAPKEPKSLVPYVLPLESAYRDLLETST